MPLAGKLTDKLGARGVGSAGMIIAMLGTLAYTQLRAGTPYLYLASALLVIGIGIGSTIVPSMAAAFQALSREETPRATSALNVIQRIAGAIGTALFAIILQHTITANLPHHPGGVQALTALPPAARAHAAPMLAGAFDTTFWVAVALIAAALLPTLLLPRPSRENQPAGQAAARGTTP